MNRSRPLNLETGTPSPWTFTDGPLLGNTMSAAGVAGNGVGYFTSGNPNAPQGTQVAFVQGAGSSFSQSINFSAGTHSLTFQAAQRGVNGGETFNVLVDGQVVGSFKPGGTSYSTFTTNNFALSAGSHTIEFLGAGSAGGKGTALIDNVRLNTIPGPAQKLAVVQQPTTATAGAAISPAVTVAVEDANGNTVTNDSSTVRLTLSSGTFAGGSNTATASAANGVATFGSLVINTAGSYTLAASDASLTGATSAAFTITAGAASKLAIVQQPTTATAGATMSPAVTVAVDDANGNTVTNDSSTVTLTLSSGTFAGGSNTATATLQTASPPSAASSSTPPAAIPWPPATPA